jgi:phage tail protein X
MQKEKWIITLVVITIAVFFLTGIYLINTVNKTVNSIIQPVVQANSGISTQVAELLHPTPTILPDPVTIIHAVQPLARLETIQYSVEKVITGETGQGLFKSLVGDKLLFIAHGTVIAGVDLGKLTLDQIEERDGALVLNLPEPEIFIASLNNEQSYIYDRQTGIFSKGNPQLETDVRRAAEREIEAAARNDGILVLAKQNAVAFLTNFLIKLGYNNVVVAP